MSNPEKKIVFAINGFTVGGAQNQLLRQFQHYNRNKFKIYLLILAHDSVKKNLLTSIPDFVTVQTFNFKGFCDISNWVKLFVYLYNIKPHLVISSLFFTNTVIRIVKLILPFSVISREHNTYVDKKKIQILTDHFLAFVSKKIVAVSEEVANFASNQANIKRSKFTVIENGIDLAIIDKLRSGFDDQAFRIKLGLDTENIVYLHVGRLVEQKNQTLLIKGFSKYVQDNKQARLIIVGDGSMKGELEELTERLGIKNKVLFVGEQMDVNPYYHIADAFISTSTREGMSNTQLEAVANGVPIITTRTGGTSSIIKPDHNGVFIQEQTPISVCSAIIHANELDLSYLSQNMWRERERFDITNTVHAYESLFIEYSLN